MTREPSDQRPRRRRQWAAACALAAALALTSCGAMPRSGPVHKVVEPTAEAEEQPTQYSPATPQMGASAQEIVEGFLAAGVGAQDDYAVARQYLTPQLANTWRPDSRVLVHTGEPSTVPRLNDGQFRTSLEVSAERSANGVLEQQPEGTTRVLDFTLTSVDGQWRISEAPDGVIVPFGDFPEIFKAYTLYFFDDEFGRLVPDSRWFAERSTVPTAMVRELLAGPAPHLDGAVTSALPGGASLARSAVPVSDSTASVDLNLAEFDPADVEQGRRMEQQLEATLQRVPSVDSVELNINGAPVETSGSDTEEPVREVTVPNRQIGISNNQLAFYQGGQTELIDDVPISENSNIVRPGMDQAMEHFGWIDNTSGTLFTAVQGDAPLQRWKGQELTRPSFDIQGWVWGSGADGVVHAARADADEDAVSVSAEWLDNEPIAGLRISREGNRALIVTVDSERESSNVWLAGIVRDESGRPTELNQGNLVAADVDVDTVQWISGTEFVTTALGESDNAQPRRYNVSGSNEALPSLVGVTSLAGGNGHTAIYGAADGNLYMLTGNSWAQQSDNVTDTAFAG